MNKEQVIKKLLNKTVANGCTVEEADSAKQMAEKIAQANGINIHNIMEPKTDAPRGWASQEAKDRQQARKTAEWIAYVQNLERKKANRNPFVDPPKYKREQQRVFNSIGALVEYYLRNTSHSYSEIVEEAKAQFPGANTSNKSVASVACNLRKKGVSIPKR